MSVQTVRNAVNSALTPGSEKGSVYYDAESGNFHNAAHMDDMSSDTGMPGNARHFDKNVGAGTQNMRSMEEGGGMNTYSQYDPRQYDGNNMGISQNKSGAYAPQNASRNYGDNTGINSQNTSRNYDGSSGMGQQNISRQYDEGADINRKPSVATGGMGMGPREGILSNKQDVQNPNTNQYASGAQKGLRDSGYASAHTANEKGSVAFDQPSPAYEAPNTSGASNMGSNTIGSKTMGSNTGGFTGASSRAQQETGGFGQSQPNYSDNTAAPTSPTRSERERTAAGAFAGGAAVTGPTAIPEEDIVQHQRTATAESQLSNQAMKKINRNEDTNDIFGPASAKESKQLSKVIKSEGAAQKKSLSTSYDQLSKLQKLQKQACTDESRALKAHGKASEYTHKMHSRFLDAKAAWEKAEATEKSKADMLAASQERARKTTENLASKSKECEELRRINAVDEREREAKLAEIGRIGKSN